MVSVSNDQFIATYTYQLACNSLLSRSYFSAKKRYLLEKLKQNYEFSWEDKKIHFNSQSTPNRCVCDTSRDQRSSAAALQKHHVPFLPGQALTLLGRQVTGPRSMYSRETQSITFRFTAARAFPQKTPSLPWCLLSWWAWGEWTWHLQLDPKDFTSCVTYLMFMSDKQMTPGRGAHRGLQSRVAQNQQKLLIMMTLQST